MRTVRMETLLSLLTPIVLVILSGVASQSPGYQPECRAWDGTIIQICQSLQLLGGSAKCIKSPDCTGLSCTLEFWGKTMMFETKLYPCYVPPQMRLLVRSSTVNFEQTITHGNTFNLSGLEYVPFRSMPYFKLAVVMVVHFDKVPNGLRVGMSLESRGFGTGVRWPLMPDTIVPTPPCPTEPATPSQCGKMDQLLTTMTAPQGFLCAATTDCDGFSCAGSIDFLGILTYDLNTTLVVNSCDSPISYTVHLISRDASLNYAHKFTHSDTVPVKSVGMPPGTTANLTVNMQPSANLDSIDTSLQMNTCIAPMVFLNPNRECHQAPLLVNQPVPIPPCEAPLPTVPIVPAAPPQPLLAFRKAPPTDVAAECDAWNQIQQSMTQASISGYGFDSCTVSADCTGMSCHAVYEANNYVLVMKLYHCARPPTLYVTVDSPDTNFHFGQNVTSNVTVPVTNDMSIGIRMHPVAGGVLLGGTLKSTILGGIPIELPIIKDRVVPTPPCPGSPTSRPDVRTMRPIQPTKPKVPTRTDQQGVPTSRQDTHTIQPLKTKVPIKTDQQGGNQPSPLLPLGGVTEDNDAPQQDPVKQDGVNGMIVGVAVAFAAFFTIVVLASIYYFSRRHSRTRGADEVVLVGDNGSSDA